MSKNKTPEIEQTVDYIRKKIKISPKIGIICGSGLGGIADAVNDRQVLKYSEIPGFPTVTVVGHEGNLVFGTIGGKPVVLMQGRFHQYEGYHKREIALPIRVMKLLGVTTLLISNAAGGLNPTLKVGDFVILNDHISPSGLSLDNVLIGPNDERFGTRFPSTADAYCKQLIQLMHRVAQEQKQSHRVHEGVYYHIAGPTYASNAESQMMIQHGADVVGMSTVPEVIVARHCGLNVFAISLVTDVANSEAKSVGASHEEVIKMASVNAKDLQLLFVEFIKNIQL